MAKYDIILNIKIDQEIKNCLDNMADEQDMTASAVVREILQQFFKKKNNLNEKQIYYYDHLLNEIINNKDRLNNIEFKANFGKNPSIETSKIKGAEIEDITREYIISLLQNKEIKIQNPAFQALLDEGAFTTFTPNNPYAEEENFEDIEDGLANKPPQDDDLNEEFKVEIHFKDSEEVDLTAVEPRQVIKKPAKN